MRIHLFVLAFLLAAGLAMAHPAQAALPPSGQVRAQIPLPWDQPPPEFKEMERQGFHAGVQAAIKDYDHHRSPEPQRRKEYRHPKVERGFQNDFRHGFVRGYNDAYKHMMKSNGEHP